MALNGKRAHLGSAFAFMLIANLTAFISTTVSARGETVGERFEVARHDVTEARSDSSDEGEPEKLLQTAIHELNGVGGGSKLWHGHRAQAVEHIEDALKDGKDDGAHRNFKEELDAALDEIKICLDLAKKNGSEDQDDSDAADSSSDTSKSPSSSDDDSTSENPFGSITQPGSGK